MLLIAYAADVLLLRPLTIAGAGRTADVRVGFTGGITGGLAGFPGATMTIWRGMKGWNKQRQRGTYQPFILVMQVLAAVGFVFRSVDLNRCANAAIGTQPYSHMDRNPSCGAYAARSSSETPG